MTCIFCKSFFALQNILSQTIIFLMFCFSVSEMRSEESAALSPQLCLSPGQGGYMQSKCVFGCLLSVFCDSSIEVFVHWHAGLSPSV